MEPTSLFIKDLASAVKLFLIERRDILSTSRWSAIAIVGSSHSTVDGRDLAMIKKFFQRCHYLKIRIASFLMVSVVLPCLDVMNMFEMVTNNEELITNVKMNIYWEIRLTRSQTRWFRLTKPQHQGSREIHSSIHWLQWQESGTNTVLEY